MNFGIFISTGQPLTQGAFLHWRHLFASSNASFSSNPKATSSKFFTLPFTGLFFICLRLLSFIFSLKERILLTEKM